MNAMQMEELRDMETAERERFQVETIEQANWALRKLGAIQAKQGEIAQLAAAEMARIKAWQDAETRKLDDDKAFFEQLLTDYAGRQRAADPDWKKVTTPYGAIKYHKQQPKWHYDDERLLESLKSAGRGDLIRIKEELNKTEIKKALKQHDGMFIDPDTGAVVEGVRIEQQGDKVVIEVDA